MKIYFAQSEERERKEWRTNERGKTDGGGGEEGGGTGDQKIMVRGRRREYREEETENEGDIILKGGV